ncbi:MAG: hypothetical protein ACOCXG_01910 [Nanoarchaeota archaeon]
MSKITEKVKKSKLGKYFYFLSRYAELEKYTEKKPKTDRQKQIQDELSYKFKRLKILIIVSIIALIGLYFSIASIILEFFIPFSGPFVDVLQTIFGLVGAPGFFLVFYIVGHRKNVLYTEMMILVNEFIAENKYLEMKKRK